FKYKKEGVDLKVEVKTRREGDKFILQVCDNGRGIDLDKFGNSLFKLYARIDASAQGKGVGLYLVKKQVEAMNGTIEVASKLNVGTTFTITLPILSSRQIRHQVAFENQVVKVTFDGMTEASVTVWQKAAASEEFREAIMANLEKIREYSAKYWINDTTRFGGVSEEDNTWFVEEIMPRATRLDLKAIVIVHSLGKGFDSPHWSLLKKFCAQHNIVFAFKSSLEEAGIFLTTLRSDNS
ncbi:MAG TPA: ATP-binding protein, partial [Flammeovirgaceae bacterium]|nr:ATP-binding protein [Flammeovirgaceae bacterium]